MGKLAFIGFHATSQENWNKIKKDDFIINKNRKNEWLGYGIYLFEHKINAISWGKRTYYCLPKPRVIKCFIEVEEDKYLDLDDPEKLSNYDEFYKKAFQLASEHGKALSFKDKNIATCWGLNLYKKKNNIDLIKYTFKSNRTKKIMEYGDNNFGYSYNEVQICVSRKDIIVRKELCS